MTTIAFDGEKLVSDSLTTINGRRILGDTKKIIVAGPDDEWKLLGRKVLAFALSGDGGVKELVKHVLSKGVGIDQPFTANNVDFRALLIVDTGEVFDWMVSRTAEMSEDHDLHPVTGPIAIGSGASFAEATLALGKGAKTAVKTAIRLDIYSGGKLQVYKLPFKGVKKFKV